MRVIALVTVAVVAGACARPVLYYPTPGGAPAPRGAPDNTGSAPSTAEATAAPATQAGNAADLTVSDAAATGMIELQTRHIILPVATVSGRIADSFGDGRDDGERTHHAIDIMAPRGTPILSADDGRVLRMSSNTLGGITMYTTDPDGHLVYYYAHMERYNDAMSAGREIVKGDTLGYVGTTGNAPENLPHLHFQVMVMPADGKYWEGQPINPFALLVEARAARDSVMAARADAAHNH
jgi:murein DD-endopeptidase MepM/ murein hydrolase activator NlpD